MDQEGQPVILRLSRRELIALGGVAAVGAALPTMAGRRPAPGRVDLAAAPSHCPGYAVRGLGDGGLLLWSRDPAGELLAYGLSPAGRAVWALCDGVASPAEIGAAYQRQSGRPADEAVRFVDRLVAVGVVARGGYVVTGGGFPRAHAGGAYHVRLDGEAR